jgi:micrococcal nuclease
MLFSSDGNASKLGTDIVFVIRRLTVLVALLALALTALAPVAAQERDDDEDIVPEDAVQVEFIEVIDGDTFDVDYDLGPDRDYDRIRLIGIDTPENSYSYGNEPECYGQESMNRLESILLSADEIWVERDVDPVDPNDRLLRYVWYVSGTDDHRVIFLNEQLVEEGYAVARDYRPNLKHQDRLDDAEVRAIEEGRGMWTACDASVSLDPDLEDNDVPDDAPIDRTVVPITDSDEELVCSFFDTKDEAQDFLDIYPEMAEDLDPDGNGEACDAYFD